MVFQNGAACFNPVHRLVDQVAEPLVQRGTPKRQALNLARTKLTDMGLAPDLAGRYPHELSGGQIQRGLLAMSLILDPPVLILDEPTAALDAVTKSFVAEVIRDCRDQNKSVLLITHDLDLAGALADEIAVLYLARSWSIFRAAFDGTTGPPLYPGPSPGLSHHGCGAGLGRDPGGCVLPDGPCPCSGQR